MRCRPCGVSFAFLLSAASGFRVTSKPQPCRSDKGHKECNWLNRYPNAFQRLHHLKEREHRTACMGGCLGGCVKPPPPTPSNRPGLQRPRSSKRRVRRHTAEFPREWWTTSSNDVDNHSTVSARSFQNFPSAQKPDTISSTAYSNHALALWNEQRCAWVGTQPRLPPPREPRASAISSNTTYEELLATNRPFTQPVPLPEMVEFLVGVWEQEGMYELR